jgi:hypothetical protein
MGTILILVVYDQYEDHFGEKNNTYLIMLIFSDETFSYSLGCLLAKIKGTNTTGELIKYICTVWALDKLETRTWGFSPEFSLISGLTKAISPCPLVSAVSKDAELLMAIVPELTGILPTLAGLELCY